jgi:hypothetical protein
VARIPPPYEEVAPDGRQYFKLLGVPTHLIRMYELLLRASELATVRPDLTGKLQAQEIDALILATKNRVDNDARATALEADRMIRSRIEASRVRPPTLGVKNSQTSLMGGVESRPVPSVLPGGGAVGIADVQALIRATLRPSANSSTPYYWRAQEFGSDHNVGRVIMGVFQPGAAAPDARQRRVHPVFEVRGKGAGDRYPMKIRRPIPERAFLREGAWDAYIYRRARFEATEAVAVDRMRQISAISGRGKRR